MTVEERQRTLGTFVASLGTGLKLAWTVSIPDKYHSRYTNQNRWMDLTPDMQYDFFKDHYIPKVIMTNTHAYYCIFEQNKAGHVHMHALCHLALEESHNAYHLQCIRQNMKHLQICQQIVKRNRYVNLNHIVECTRLEEWVDYLSKDSLFMPRNPIIKYPAVRLERLTEEPRARVGSLTRDDVGAGAPTEPRETIPKCTRGDEIDRTPLVHLFRKRTG